MSDLLTIALKAHIPVIRVTCDDPENAPSILRDICDREVVEAVDIWAKPKRWRPGHVYVDVQGAVSEEDVTYTDMLERDATLVVVNPDDDAWLYARDCGALVPRIEYIEAQLEGWLSTKQIKRVRDYLVGMSIRDVIETIMITQSRDHALTGKGINETKSYLGAGMHGLESVDTNQVDYVPPEWADDWLAFDAPLLGNSNYRELWPKGFMLYGPTGTGKTELARYIANKLGWPLYQLDLGSLYSRWQGESERNLRKALDFISAKGESVFLLDEAEKLFGNDAVGQASLSTLLSMLLWWLQGETNRTITVMTSNDIEVIPPELYRPGRLDAVHRMAGLSAQQLEPFIETVSKRMGAAFELDPTVLCKTVFERYSGFDRGPFSQASVVAQIRSAAKRMIIEKEQG